MHPAVVLQKQSFLRKIGRFSPYVNECLQTSSVIVVLYGIYSIKRIPSKFQKFVALTFSMEDCVIFFVDGEELLWTHCMYSCFVYDPICFKISSPVTFLQKKSLFWDEAVKFFSQIYRLYNFVRDSEA